MKIRNTLLLAFLAVGLLPALLLALLAFERARAALQGEIERNLDAQAQVLLSEVSQLMGERWRNALTWRRVAVMQDLKVRDVDKRLAEFLARLQRGYDGLYLELAVTDLQGQVVASSRAAAIGQAAPSGEPWLRLAQEDATLAVERPQVAAAGEAAPSLARLRLRVPVGSDFGEGALGELRLDVDWSRVDARLERVASAGRDVALLDREGRLIAASRQLLARLGRDSGALAAFARPASPGAAAPAATQAIDPAAVFTGVAAMEARGRPEDLGWRVVVLAPRDEALRPIRNLALAFAGLLALVALLTLAVAGGISRRLAQPIVALTAFSRQYRRGQTPPQLPRASGSEVGELASAFTQMVAQIEQSQQQLARATALAAVGEMSSVIAHEVRTPLGVMLSSAQILQREASISTEGRELLGFIESETGRLARLISSMLEGARPREPQFAPHEINALLSHAVGLLSAQAAKQEVQVQLRPTPAPLWQACDGEQMTQVLLNLILNGLQILPRGGRILITPQEAGGELRIDIADDGPGIAPEARSRVFEAFFFQREGGIGLGLAVVQRIVTAHGGRIEAAQSELGGALFRIHLPRRTQ